MYLTYFDRDNDINIYFLYSPFHELLGSLHVLSKHEHHMPRQIWAEEMIKKLPTEIKDKILFYANVTSNFLGVIGFLENKKLWDISISECIGEIANISEVDFFYTIFNGEIDKQSIINAINSNYYNSSIPNKYVECLKGHKEYKKQFIIFLKEYYYNYFVNELSFTEPILIRKLKREFERCKEISVYDYIHSLHPRIEVTDNKINFHKYKLFEVNKENINQVIFKVDSYIIPHLLLGTDENQKLISLIIPTYITSYDDDKLPKDTLNIFKAIADETRMKIIRNLYRQPMSTQKLADRLNLTEACISKHLKILYNTDIVTKIRDGNYINYHLNQRIIDSLVLYIYEYINQ
ncbi:ArsR/SmtB family transcription factor [Vallitalea guaymasensis]|uniref:Winged helix-turn-helix transcriptional regulator n=1 Tax=Vallitalea guaymasensis TaxID=1185412 RepID=A0A8J8MF95_9FIRM|nr:metalloregulator ArsR/SmtB family transcription factor [Vallitalea guaymasensis]QUH31846.1 winged helix-turn-helix transcriptional regulator [Vallitalea guaymasensis]